MSITLYFGDNDELSDFAILENYDAFLINTTNYLEFLNSDSKDCVCYTSLGDLPKDLKIAVSILCKADTVIYCPPLKKNNYSELSEDLLLYVSDFTKVKNIELCYNNSYDCKNISRNNETPQLWIAGCSVSHGIGVNENEKYGNILSRKINLPVQFLTHPGSSIMWAADQILKSDLKTGDIVCWGLTAPYRFPFFYQNKLIHVNPYHYETNLEISKIIPISYLTSENTLYQSIAAIESVLNFCSKLDVRLIMFDAVPDASLNKCIKKNHCYYQFFYPLNKDHHLYNTHGLNVYSDFGTDNLHPGPITHQQYSNFLATIIESN